MNSFRPGIKLLIKLLISLAFFSVLFSFVQKNELMAVIARIDWFYFGLSIALIPVMLAASCAKWKLVLDKSGTKISFGKLLRIYLIGYFFSNFLPSTVGGDVVRSYYAGRLINNQAFSAVAIFIERFSGVLMLFGLVVAMPLLQPSLYGHPSVLIPAAAGLFFLVATVLIARMSQPAKLIEIPMGIAAKVVRRLTQVRGLSFLNSLFATLERLSSKIATKMGKVRKEMNNAV